jgi:NADPH:quinone reductase-like Zn-dependent oxidoreductase
VRIAVAAAGVNPVDTKIREGAQADRFPYIFPAVLGFDAAGVVTEVGPAVVNVRAGDDVIAFCREDFVGQGAYAETVCVSAAQVVTRERLDATEGAALPLAGLTAYQGLNDGLKVERGETVVIRGASGGVGSFAVQIAAAQGAHVLAVASGKSESIVRELGAHEFVDYHDPDPIRRLRELAPDGADALLDLVGGDELDDYATAIRSGGRVTSTLEPLDDRRWPERNITGRYVYVQRNGAQLARLVELHSEGQLRGQVADVLPLGKVAEAHRRLESGGIEGKLVLQVG